MHDCLIDATARAVSGGSITADSTYANVTNGFITRYAFKNNDHELVHSICLVENVLSHVLHLHWP